jgi:CheY-like chemotaxis protein
MSECPSPIGVLVADDEPDLLTLFDIALKDYGFLVWLAKSGEEAVEVYQQHQRTIDIVLLDVEMPGLDGPQTLQVLRCLNPAVRASFMTGGCSKYDEPALLNQGAAYVFRKPFQLQDLAALLRRLVTESAPPENQ